MALVNTEQIFQSTNDENKSYQIVINDPMAATELYVTTIESGVTSTMTVDLWDGKNTNRQLREVAKKVVEFFGLSYVEVTSIRNDLVRFVRSFA